MTNYYLSPYGDDSKNGLSPSTAWLTAQYAANIAAAGDVVNFMAGGYGRFVPQNNGGPGIPIIFKPYGDGPVYIDGGSTYANISAYTNKYIRFQELNLVGATAVGIQLGGDLGNPTEGLELIKLFVTGCQKSGIDDYYSKNLLIDECELFETNTTPMNEVISLSGTNGFEVVRCKVHKPIAESRNGIDAKLGCQNGLIHHNEVWDHIYCPLYVDCQGKPSANIDIFSNYAHDCISDAVSISDELMVSTLTNINIYNNILTRCRRGFAIYHQISETFNFKFINNTLYNNNISGSMREILLMSPAAYMINCVLRNNIIHPIVAGAGGIQYDDYASGGATIDHNLFYNSGGAWNYTNVFGTDYIDADPKFVQPGVNFKLLDGSPAIDAGSSLDAPSDDIIGTHRPQGAAIDIGAYETRKGISMAGMGVIGAGAALAFLLSRRRR